MIVKGNYLNGIKTDVSCIIKFIIAIEIYLSAMVFDSEKLLLFSVLIMNLYCIIKGRKNDLIFVMFIFIGWCNFTIANYYWFESDFRKLAGSYSWWRQYDNVMRVEAQVIYLFFSTIFVGFPQISPKKEKKSLNIKFNKQSASLFANSNYTGNMYMGYILLGMIIIISLWRIILTIKTRTYIESTIYEYSLILYIMAYFSSSGNKTLDALITSVLLVNVIFIITNGDRGTAVNFGLLLFGVFFRDRINHSIMIIGGLLFIIFMNGIGMWRGMYEFNLGIFVDSIKNLLEMGGGLSTSFAAEASGIAMVKYAFDKGWGYRVYLLEKYLVSIFLGSNKVGRDAILPLLTMEEYGHHNGGGVLPNFGYFYLGYFGVIILGLIVVIYIRKISVVNEKSNPLIKCISIYVFTTVPHWYLYSPAPLIRGMLLLCIVFYLSTRFVFKNNAF